MHAIEVAELGGPEVLSYVESSPPSPGAGEVLIKAEAIGVNFIDTYFRSAVYPHELPFVMGAEVAGTVEAVGDGVMQLRAGDRVATADAVGAYAEYCVAPAELVAALPAGVAADVAAAALLKGMTAQLLVKSVYPVQPGDTVLLHAGAGGVGLILTQWATSLGARVITTASTPAKAELSRQAGAGRGPRLPRRPAAIRRENPRPDRRQRRGSSTTASASRRSTRAWPAWPSGARSHCSARPADRFLRSTRSGSTQQDPSISLGHPGFTSCAPATSSLGAPANYLI